MLELGDHGLIHREIVGADGGQVFLGEQIFLRGGRHEPIQQVFVAGHLQGIDIPRQGWQQIVERCDQGGDGGPGFGFNFGPGFGPSFGLNSPGLAGERGEVGPQQPIQAALKQGTGGWGAGAIVAAGLDQSRQILWPGQSTGEQRCLGFDIGGFGGLGGNLGGLINL